MKKIKFIIPAIVLGLTSISCNNYLDINENPNVAHIEDVSPSFVFPGAVAQLSRIQTGEDSRSSSMMTFGSLMMNNWSHNPNSYGNPFASEYNLSSVDNAFYGGIWNGIYLYCANFKLIEDYPNTDHKQDYYIAMAKIMKAFYMQYIVDLYGDAPYTEAFKRTANLTPKYDDDQEIYKALIKDLEDANVLISAANANAIIPTTEDIVFNGTMSNWTKFANTIKLRMLLRMSNVTGVMATYRDAKLATLATLPTSSFVTADVTENPGYSSGNDAKMSPFLYSYRVNAAGANVTNYLMLAPTEHIASALNGTLLDVNYTKFSGIVDPRSSRLFTLISSKVSGVRQGANAGAAGVPPTGSVSRLGAGNFSGVTALSLVSGNRGGMIMSLAESKLLQAEAAVRYPSVFTSIVPLTAFNAAIDASGVWLGATAGLVTTYKTAIATRVGLGFTGTDAQKIEAIMTQKWIALANVNPTESFIEYNRTGYPYSPMAITSSAPNKPYRLMYPVSEYVGNSANVPNLTSAQLFVKNQYTPFWK